MRGVVQRADALHANNRKVRKQPRKQEQGAVIATEWECWQFVHVDFEGPCAPPDRWGNVYAGTYQDDLSTATISGALTRLSGSY